MKLADLHCDTPYELYHREMSLDKNLLHISLEKADFLEKYIQIAAVWSDHRLSDDDAYEDFLRIADDFKSKAGDLMGLSHEKFAFILAVEDIRLVGDDICRIKTLREKGVRFATLTWKDLSCIGGSWNTDTGLTPFGREVLNALFENGIVPDVSHGSRRLTEEVIDIAKAWGKPVCASHSCSFEICPHRRNLTAHHAKMIAESGGLIGVNYCPSHLTDEKASIEDVINHISYLVSVCGEDSIALGSDFDGVSALPEGISDITSTDRIYRALLRKFGEKTADKILFDNIYNFLLNNIPEVKK